MKKQEGEATIQSPKLHQSKTLNSTNPKPKFKQEKKKKK